MRALGFDAGARYGDAARDVIGAVETTPAGNVAVRIGVEMRASDAAEGWTQTGYVVLTPDEARELAANLESALEQ